MKVITDVAFRRKPQTPARQNPLQIYELLELVFQFMQDDNRSLRQARLVNTLWHSVISQDRSLSAKCRQRRHLRELVILLFGADHLGMSPLGVAGAPSWYSYRTTGGGLHRRPVCTNDESGIAELYECTVHVSHWDVIEGARCDSETYLLIYSAASRRSFGDVVQWHGCLMDETTTAGRRYANIVRQKRCRPRLLGVLAVESDGRSEIPNVDAQEGRQWAHDLGCPFYQVARNDRQTLDRMLDDFWRTYKGLRMADKKAAEETAKDKVKQAKLGWRLRASLQKWVGR